MEVDFDDASCKRLEADLAYEGGFGREVVKAFRKRLQLIRAAVDERDFYALKSLHFEKLKGARDGQYSKRLNAQWRLILRFATGDGGKKIVVIVSITDYH